MKRMTLISLVKKKRKRRGQLKSELQLQRLLGRKKPGKTSVFLDVKPWDHETDMKKLEEALILPGPIPAAPLLHGGLPPADFPRVPAVPGVDHPGADAADVGRLEYDVRHRPPPRALPDRLVQGEHEHQGGGRADDQRAKQ